MVSRMREGTRQEAVIKDKTVGHAAAEAEHHNGVSVNWKEALYLATRGGALALDIPIGMFAVGAPFDAQHSTFRPSFRLPRLP